MHTQAPTPLPEAGAQCGGAGGLECSESGSGLPLLLLSPPMTMPTSLLPLPPLSVSSAGAASRGGAAALAASGAAAAADAEAERLLHQQQFRPTSSKLSEMFKPLEEQQQQVARGAGSGSATAAAVSPVAVRRSPRTAAELRAAILRLAQMSPPQQQPGAAALLALPLPLGPPAPAGGTGLLQMPAAGAAVLQAEHGTGLSLLDLSVLEALSHPAAAQYR